MNFILKSESAVYYECGYSCDNCIFLKIGGDSFFITDGRYAFEAKENIKNAIVIECQKDIATTSREIIRKYRIKNILYDPLHWSVEEFGNLNSKLTTHFIPKKNLSQKKRIIKTKEEIEIIKKAADFGKEAFEKFANFLQNKGYLQEERYLHFQASNILSFKGELSLSFDPIVAIDENAAKPHALPGKTALTNNSLLLFDAGVKYKRYCSDRTRVLEFDKDRELNFSKIQKFKDKQRQKIYDIVLKAQESAINIIKPGVTACEIDKKAREIIEKAGYGKYFMHSTGHGVGLDIHELPRISNRDDSVIEEGMVFTVEPGIYLPGEFGVRIEDMVAVTHNGVKIL